MARKIKNLSVKTREYKDRDGNSKANWVNIGVIMENDQGKQFMLLDKWINFAGIPDFSGKVNSGSIMVSMFDVDNDYKPSRKDIPPSYKGNDDADDWNSSRKVPEVDEIPFYIKYPRESRPVITLRYRF